MLHCSFGKISLTITSLILMMIALLWFLLQPNADIDNYQSYYHHDSAPLRDNTVKITFLGTTSLLFDDGETQLMIDGFISRPPLWQVIASKLTTDKPVVDAMLNRLQVNRLQGVFASHSHYDHALDIAYIAQRTGAKLYGSISTLNIGRGAGLTADQLQLYQPKKVLHIGQFSIMVLPSKHTPAVVGVGINDDLGEQINAPLQQPVRIGAYKEGGSYDFLLRHGRASFFIKPDTNFVAGALDNIRADVLLLGTAMLGKQQPAFQQQFYDETVGKIHPQLVVPIHWDNFFHPLSEHLVALPWVADDLKQSFDFLIFRTKNDEIKFQILQGYQSLIWSSPPK